MPSKPQTKPQSSLMCRLSGLCPAPGGGCWVGSKRGKAGGSSFCPPRKVLAVEAQHREGRREEGFG